MPRLSQWYVRLALLYLILGFTAGGLMLSNKGLSWAPLLWRLLPLHIEFLLFGWTLQLALGMAFWMLPRFWEGAARGNEAWAWLALVLLNAGVLLVVLGTLATGAGWAISPGRALELAAAVAFAAHIWRRIVPRN